VCFLGFQEVPSKKMLWSLSVITCVITRKNFYMWSHTWSHMTYMWSHSLVLWSWMQVLVFQEWSQSWAVKVWPHFLRFGLLLGVEDTGQVTIEHPLTILLFSLLFCPFVLYCFRPTLSSKSHRSPVEQILFHRIKSDIKIIKLITTTAATTNLSFIVYTRW